MLLSILRVLWAFFSIFASTHLCLQYLSKFETCRQILKIKPKQPEFKSVEHPVVQTQRAGLLPLPVQNLILRNLSPIDRYRYSLANKEAQYAVSSFNRQAYRIEHILLPYFSEEEINVFRLVQRKTDTLISGSAALQFFDLGVFPDSDLDLYVVREWDRVMLLAGFLTSITYEYLPRSDQKPTFQEAFEAGKSRQAQHVPPAVGNEYHSRNIWDVYSFVRASDGKKIQIITCVHNTLQVILGFHSTCVMNVISYMYAYALYPFVTFAEQQTVAVLQSGRRVRSYENDSIQRAYTKYADRGWPTTLDPSPTNALRHKSEFRDTARSVGDSACWVISLTPVQHAISLGDYDSTSLVDPIRANSWYTILRENGQTQIGYRVHQWITNNPEDAYAFTFPSASFTAGSTIQYLGNGEDAYTFKRQSSIEDLIQLTHRTFDAEPDALHERVRTIVAQAYAAMPRFIDLEEKPLTPSVYTLVMLVQQLDVIFNSSREDPSCSITFRIDPQGKIWVCVVITLPPNYPRRSISALRTSTDEFMRNLMHHRVWIHFEIGTGS